MEWPDHSQANLILIKNLMKDFLKISKFNNEIKIICLEIAKQIDRRNLGYYFSKKFETLQYLENQRRQ